MAKKYNAYISMSMHERDPQYPDYFMNTAFIMDPNGRIILKGWDYYVLSGGSWIGVNGVADFIDHVLHSNPEKVLKGRMIPRDKFQEVMQKATDYPGFKPRCGFNKGFEG